MTGPFGGQLDAATVTPGLARLWERPSLAKLTLHLRPETYADIETGLGLCLPAAGQAVAAADSVILSIAPTEFMIVVPGGEQNAWTAKLMGAVAGKDAAVVDVSSNTCVLRLSGRLALNLLYRGCSVELDGPAFPVGCCATTKIGRITTIIHHVNDEPSFDLYVARSLAVSLLTWLTSDEPWTGVPDG